RLTGLLQPICLANISFSEIPFRFGGTIWSMAIWFGVTAAHLEYGQPVWSNDGSFGAWLSDLE
ncbi:MAG: hypothetical protein ACI33O_12095, partial [Bhargavaea sp.]